MRPSRPPFRADHVGSLLRPPALKALRLEAESGQASAEALAAAEDAAIREVVRIQEDIGLEGITDGELRRKSWHMDFLLRLGGLTSAGKSLPVTFHGPAGDLFFTRPDLRISGRVTRPKPIFVEAFKFLKSRSAPHAQAHDPVPVHALFAGRTRQYRRDGLSGPRRASSRTPPPPIAPRSPTSTPPAAATCSSTT